MGRFISSDIAVSTGQGFSGNNAFAYCGNNPVVRSDDGGNAWETIWDILSLGSSILDVAMNPKDPWAWIGLAGDLIDVAIPFVGGIGEATRAINAATEVIDAVDDIHDAGKAADRIDDATDAYKAMSGGLCFVAGTSVLTQDGEVAIESIRTGDMVWAWDETTDTVVLKEVVETYVNKTEELVHVFVNGEEIVATPGHPFYSPVKGWTEAIHLRAGDVLILVNGEHVIIEKVQHEILELPVTVYNFQVEDYHTYFVGDAGILVHNSCSKSPAFDENQQVVLDLAKEYKKTGMTRSEATILVDWAKEYGVDSHYPAIHPKRAGMWSFTEHINIRNTHIRIID